MNTERILLQIFLSGTALLAWPSAARAQFNFTTNNGAVTITQYTGSGGDVIIPNTLDGMPVVAVGSAAFYQVGSLTSVSFGTNVTSIADNAIFQCPSLLRVAIPAGVTNIGSGPMIDCKSLTTISVSPANPNYTNVDQVLFNTPQTSLIEFPGGVGGSYTIPATVTNTGQAFIGNSLTSIGVNAANTIYTNVAGVLFDKSTTYLISYPGGAPGSYVVPSNVTTIVSAAFEYSTGVTNVTIGTNVSSIGLFAFYDCPNLAAISVDARNPSYSSTNGILFDHNKTTLVQYPIAIGGSYQVPGTVVDIGDGAFGDAFGLNSIIIPNSVTNIAQQAFYGCLNLSSVALGEGVTSIGPNAFFYCSSLVNLVFPASVTSLGQYSFGACQKLSSVCFAGNAPTDGGSVFYFDRALSTISYVNGTGGWDTTYDAIPTVPRASCGGSLPQLIILRAAGNIVLTWPAAFAGFTLESSTNLVSPAAWATDAGAPVIINDTYTATRPVSRLMEFFRLSR